MKEKKAPESKEEVERKEALFLTLFRTSFSSSFNRRPSGDLVLTVSFFPPVTAAEFVLSLPTDRPPQQCTLCPGKVPLTHPQPTTPSDSDSTLSDADEEKETQNS